MDKKGIIIFICLTLLVASCGRKLEEEPKQSMKLFPVEKEGKFGYIDKTGNLVIEPQFDSAWDFSEGLARVSIGGKYGFIDAKGKYVINPQFPWAFPFSEGLAPVEIDGEFGYIDKTGKFLIEPGFGSGFSLF